MVLKENTDTGLQAHAQKICPLQNRGHDFNLCHVSGELGGWALRTAL